MKALKYRNLFLMLITTTTLAAGASTREEIARSSDPVAGVFNINPRSLAWDGIYKFSADTEVIPLQEFSGGREVPNSERRTLGFTRGEPVAVEFLDNNQVALSVLLPDSEKGRMPDRIVISRDEFERSGLDLAGRGGAKELEEQYSTDESEQVARRGGGRFKHAGRMHFRGMAGCVAYVSRALGGIALPHGRDVVGRLVGSGQWRRASCSSPVPGMVASWSGGGHGFGHTAIWRGGWCYDKGCHDPGSKYRMTSCAVRR